VLVNEKTWDVSPAELMWPGIVMVRACWTMT